MASQSMNRVLSGYQLVLASYMGMDRYEPEIVFQMYLPPTAVTWSPREPHTVSALMYGVHVDSGSQVLGDLSISYVPGAGLSLSSTDEGAPTIADGQARWQYLHDFLSSSSELIHLGTHRLEFHSDTRNIHLVVIPNTREYRMEAGRTSRVGGAETTLSFVAVGETEGGVSLFGVVDRWLSNAKSELGRVTGALALGVAIAEQSLSIPAATFQPLRSLLKQCRVLVSSVRGVIDAGKSIAEIPLDVCEDAASLAAAAKQTYQDNLDAMASVLDIADRIDALWATAKVGSQQSSTGAPGVATTAALTVDSPCTEDECDAYVTTLEEQGDDLADSLASEQTYPQTYQSAAELSPGWVPHTVGQGEDLVSIAGQVFGDPSMWVDIAAVNDLYSSAVAVGSVVKIPVSGGGFPWSLDISSDLEGYLKLLHERLFYRDLRLIEVYPGYYDLEIDEDRTDVKTITGVDNFIQRYRRVVFHTETGTNPEFPHVGVFLGIGRAKRASTLGLTHVSSRGQLLSDPRTSDVRTVKSQDYGDRTVVQFEVETVSGQPLASTLLNLEVAGG